MRAQCLDGSSSVNAQNFNIMKHCALQLTSKFSWNSEEKIPPTRFALLQFNNEAHLHTQLTAREEDFATRLQGPAGLSALASVDSFQ